MLSTLKASLYGFKGGTEQEFLRSRTRVRVFPAGPYVHPSRVIVPGLKPRRTPVGRKWSATCLFVLLMPACLYVAAAPCALLVACMACLPGPSRGHHFQVRLCEQAPDLLHR